MEKRFVYMATTCLGPNDRDSARLCNGVLTPHAADGSHEDPLFSLIVCSSECFMASERIFFGKLSYLKTNGASYMDIRVII